MYVPTPSVHRVLLRIRGNKWCMLTNVRERAIWLFVNFNYILKYIKNRCRDKPYARVCQTPWFTQHRNVEREKKFVVTLSLKKNPPVTYPGQNTDMVGIIKSLWLVTESLPRNEIKQLSVINVILG